MSDVLSAEQVREKVDSLSDRLLFYGAPPSEMESMDNLRDLARSHEQLREEVEALERMGRSYNDLWRQEKERAEAAVRAGGCAADLARALGGAVGCIRILTMDAPNAGADEFVKHAQEALDAHDRAVSGQTAEKEEA